MNRYLLLLVATPFAFGVTTLTGCGGNDMPRPVAAENHIDQRIQERTDGRVRVVEFKKTDGQKAIRGVERYVLEYEAKAQFLERCLTRKGLGVTLCEGDKYPSREQMMELMASWRGDRYSTSKKGKKVSIRGSVTFERKESGWHVVDQSLIVEDDEIEWGTLST